MDRPHREAYNRIFSDAFFGRYERFLEGAVGPFSFRLAETPLFLTEALRDQLGKKAEELVGQLLKPSTLVELKKAILPEYDAPGMDAIPECVQVDFALAAEGDGQLTGKLV